MNIFPSGGSKQTDSIKQILLLLLFCCGCCPGIRLSQHRLERKADKVRLVYDVVDEKTGRTVREEPLVVEDEKDLGKLKRSLMGHIKWRFADWLMNGRMEFFDNGNRVIQTIEFVLKNKGRIGTLATSCRAVDMDRGVQEVLLKYHTIISNRLEAGTLLRPIGEAYSVSDEYLLSEGYEYVVIDAGTIERKNGDSATAVFFKNGAAMHRYQETINDGYAWLPIYSERIATSSHFIKKPFFTMMFVFNDRQGGIYPERFLKNEKTGRFTIEYSYREPGAGKTSSGKKNSAYFIVQTIYDITGKVDIKEVSAEKLRN